jgi:hypothetical protein
MDSIRPQFGAKMGQPNQKFALLGENPGAWDSGNSL